MADLEQLFVLPSIGFSAFCVALARAWRDKDAQVFRDLIYEHRVRFRSEPVFASYEAQAALGTVDVSELQRGLVCARDAISALPTRPAVLHTFAAIVAELADLGAATAEELREADGLLRLASRVKPDYAKYYATRARLLTHLGNYAEAYKLAARAIEIEPSSGRNYALRVGEYQAVRLNIAVKENAQKIDLKVAQSERALESLQAEMASTRGQLIEILGLLAAVIAFVVTGAQIAVQVAADEAVPIMGAVGGAIVLAFSSLSLLYGSETRRRTAGLLMLLAVLFLSALWAVSRWSG